MRIAKTVLKFGFAVVAVLGSGSGLRASALCGPGADWMLACPAGTDVLDTSVQVSFNLPGVGTGSTTLAGTNTVLRGNPVGDIGGPQAIETELVSMVLTDTETDPLSPYYGLTLTAGDGTGNLSSDGPLFSGGAIVSSNGWTADSFFDVFFEISGGALGSTVLHNTTACHMDSTIDQVPPPYGTQYTCTNAASVLLYDQSNVQEGVLVSVNKQVVPEPASMLLIGSGLVAFWGIRQRRH